MTILEYVCVISATIATNEINKNKNKKDKLGYSARFN